MIVPMQALGYKNLVTCCILNFFTNWGQSQSETLKSSITRISRANNQFFIQSPLYHSIWMGQGHR